MRERSRAVFRRVLLRRNLGLRRRYPQGWPRLRGISPNHSEWLTDSHRRWREWSADAPDDGELITIVCPTCRPNNLHVILRNFQRQGYRSKRLIIVPNNADFDRSELERLRSEGVQVLEPGGGSLGDNLNRGLEAAGRGLVAKFDDDDEYGPDFLTHLRHALRRSGAAVAGKHTVFGYLAESDITVVRFPGHEMEYTLTLAGGTLLIDRDQCGDIEFPSLSVGEDGGFLTAVERAGGLLFASDRFNYVQRRTGDNTWQETDERFGRGALLAGNGLRLDTAFGGTPSAPQ